MNIRWSREATADLVRLHGFLVEVHPPAAAGIVKMLAARADSLSAFPRRGPRLPSVEGVELRRLIAEAYEIRYAVRVVTVEILRIFHGRGDR
jgi:toxin ParE1/3/4